MASVGITAKRVSKAPTKTMNITSRSTAMPTSSHASGRPKDAMSVAILRVSNHVSFVKAFHIQLRIIGLRQSLPSKISIHHRDFGCIEINL